MYKPTTSRTFAAKFGSLLSENVLVRCGLSRNARQIFETDD